MAEQTIVFTAGGTVQAGGGIYLLRQADEELFNLCLRGQFIYILTARQMGKSSLMVNTAQRLQSEGAQVVIIDISSIGVNVSSEAWYLGLLTEIEDQLPLETDVHQWWKEYKHLGITQRLTRFFEKVLLEEIHEKIIIFVDEIDTTLKLDFTDDFYIAIRYFYNARAHQKNYERLSFVLIGVATPGDLIKDSSRTPFNIGQRVELDDFTFEQALPLAKGLDLEAEEARQVLEWILKWTSGHPYLTQNICKAILEEVKDNWSEADVDRFVENRFLKFTDIQDANLQFVRDELTKKSPFIEETLSIYREIYLDRSIYDEGQSLIKNHLKLAGIVRNENGVLKVRNQIYKQVFDLVWVADHLPRQQVLFTVGGTVQAGGGFYINRRADEELLQLCLSNNFAYVLTPRLLGKSSLIVQTAERLMQQGTRCIIIDLAVLGIQVEVEQWYLGLLTLIEEQLDLETDVVQWWQERTHLGLTQRLIQYFKEVLLVEIAERVVIFVDEIDSTLSLNFTDDFFAAIRYLYVVRVQEPSFHRLSFVLSGVATPNDLIRDPKRTPFNVGHPVDLTDFTMEEAMPLAAALEVPQAEEVLGWVLNWTGGHPYLTQRLCSALLDSSKKSSKRRYSEADVEQMVRRTFFGAMSEQDYNLQFVRDMLTKRAPEPEATLRIYRRILRGQLVPDEEQSWIKSHLKLSGIVRREGKNLLVRNRIYAKVFNEKWIQEHLPESGWQRFKPATPIIISSLAFLWVTTGLAIYAMWQRQIAKEARMEALEQKREARRQAEIAEMERYKAEQAIQKARQQKQ